MAKENVLITGTNGSLGNFLANKYKNPICINRNNPITPEILKKGADTIIHCAFNSNLNELNNLTKKSYDDNVNLTYLLTQVPHKKFVYISSVQIPPNFLTPYAIQKQISEYIIQDYTDNYCILRVSSFLPQPNKLNTFYKISKGKDVSLTKDSVNDVVYCEDIYKAIESNLNGVLFLISREPITIEDTVKLFNVNIKFGDYHYDIGEIKSDIDIGKSSSQILSEFFKI